MMVRDSGDGIYYSSQETADADLAQFNLDHPECKLWTNWQKMCSRGPELGQVSCVTDASRPVRPSRPFCAGNNGGHARAGPPSSIPIDLATLRRFCADIATKDGMEFCSQMSPDRPFNGRDLQSLRSPYCAKWANAGGLVCSEKGSSDGLPRCSDLPKNVRTAGPYHCAQIDRQALSRRACAAVADSTSYFSKKPQQLYEGDPGGKILGGKLPLREAIVHGLYCEEFRGQ
jgi:hypothetical protein